MTLKEFFRRAKKGRTWHVAWQGGGVRDAYGRCPLGAVAGTIFPNPEPGDAAEALGLRVSTAKKIARAADWEDDEYRPWLLKQLGVKP